MGINSLYLHIPFCNNICFYCDFNKVFYNTKLADTYIDDLINSINNDLNIYKTIYIGGGSPSSLNNIQLEKLLKCLQKNIDKDCEFSFEVNPNDMDLNKIKLLKKYHVNRVSIGVQTFNEELLKTLNRKHNNNDVYNLIKKLKEEGINNISCDLMFGIPNQNDNDIIDSIYILNKLGIEHISTYALLIEDNTYFKIKKIDPLNDDVQASQYELISNCLESLGFERYEISNFAKNQHYSSHNLTYWKGEEYNCYGAGASGYINSTRFTYTRSINEYILNKKIIEKEILDSDDKEYEFIILNLRLKNGINLDLFKEKFNIDFKEKYKDITDKLIKNKMCEFDKNNFRVCKDKMFVINSILCLF